MTFPSPLENSLRLQGFQCPRGTGGAATSRPSASTRFEGCACHRDLTAHTSAVEDSYSGIGPVQTDRFALGPEALNQRACLPAPQLGQLWVVDVGHLG